MPKSGHERYESGSSNIPAAYALIEGIKWMKKVDVRRQEVDLTKKLIETLKTIEKVHLYLPKNDDKILGIISFSIEGYSADDIGNILYEEFNICIRTGYHCSPLVHDFINSTIHGGTARISISGLSTKDGISFLVNSLKTL